MNIVRFAPSPTGYLHIGGARTCLFNWLFARATGGKFILRIEDTDLSRSKKEYLDEILSSLQWMGLDWDGLYYQSQRFDIYRDYAQNLFKKGNVYKEGEALIYKVPKDINVKIHDLIHGEISIDTEQIKDQVLLKSDGSPAYNFCCVVDDALMGITHIIRGDDHISNTPKQILLYEALGLKVPKFVHIPMILGEDKSRLSKRHGATSLSEYKNEGYLPEALVNYLALLGWNPGDSREIFSLNNLTKEFSLKRVSKTAAVFDIKKLKWLNGQYIKNYDTEKLLDLAVACLAEKKYIMPDIDRKWLKSIVELYRSRFQTVNEFSELASFFFIDDIRYDTDAVSKFLNDIDVAEKLEKLKEALEKTEPFDIAGIERNVRSLIEKLDIQTGSLIHPARVALTGGAVSPGIFEVIACLGKEKTLNRLNRVIKKLKTRADLFDKLSGL
ncbi:MAG: glutamate--tRNA ligase [Candidatus Omnitrophica bacterium]|nr:glutamate--tRNA ligase [Candidatus Omnitrophota bacterium]MBU1925022.1 glutamate--tRNA ligase [Candidatus Omnitrophota bacterium]